MVIRARTLCISFSLCGISHLGICCFQSPHRHRRTVTALAFAGGFAVGHSRIWIEDLFKIGGTGRPHLQRSGDSIAASLRKEGFRVTVFDGRGRDGKVNLLFVQVRRREVGKVRNLSRMIDPQCYLVIDDVRAISYGSLEIGK